MVAPVAKEDWDGFWQKNRTHKMLYFLKIYTLFTFACDVRTSPPISARLYKPVPHKNYYVLTIMQYLYL